MRENWTCIYAIIGDNPTKMFVMNFFTTNQIVNCKANDKEERTFADIGVWKIKSLKPTKN